MPVGNRCDARGEGKQVTTARTSNAAPSRSTNGFWSSAGFAGLFLAHVTIVAALIWTSAIVLSVLINTIESKTICTVWFALIDCVLPQQRQFVGGAYFSFLFVCILMLVVNELRLRQHPVYLFFNVIFYGAAACAVFDIVLKMPIQNFSPLYSGMFNTLNIVIGLSFLFFVTAVRLTLSTFPRFVTTALLSYGQSVIGFAFFYWLQGGFLGATTSYVGFLIYAFGVFSVHLMCVVSLTVSASESTAAELPDVTLKLR